MLGTHDLALFVISGLLLNMAPGPDSLLIMARSATQGWRAGSAAALGMSALLATSATAFMLVKLIGAAYLLYIGIGMLLARHKEAAAPGASELPALPYGRIFAQGFLTNVLNPKVALFFLAFVPQFISPDAEHKALAFLLLGAIFNFNGMLWCHFLALSTAFAQQRLQVGRRVGLWLERATGGLFTLLGVKLALADRV